MRWLDENLMAGCMPCILSSKLPCKKSHKVSKVRRLACPASRGCVLPFTGARESYTMDLVALLLLEEGREPVAAPEPLPADASAASVALLCAQSNFAVLSGEGESALEARRFAFCRDVVRLGAV